MVHSGFTISTIAFILIVVATQTTAGSATANAVFSMPNHTFRAMGVAGIKGDIAKILAAVTKN